MPDIVLAPFSNSDIRDWPIPSWIGLVAELIHRRPSGPTIRIIGTPAQRVPAREIVRPFGAERVVNECGRLPWPTVLNLIRNADCVVGNNSGIAHIAGNLGAPTVCVFGGSHQRLEWRPLGSNVRTISRVIACSPCHLDHGATCPFDKACLRDIDASLVANEVEALCEGSSSAKGREISERANLRPPAETTSFLSETVRSA